jgi:peptidoglycan-N-acetylglucosamine deacetylase
MIGWIEIVQNIVYFFSLYYVVFWVLVLLDDEKPETKKLKGHPEISILIPGYNEEGNMIPTLKSVEALDYPKDKLSIYIIDDGSTDNTYKEAVSYSKLMLKNHNYKKVVVLTQKNKGKYAAMNNALKLVDTEFFASLDADSMPQKDALKKLIACFGDKQIAGVSPVMKVYKPSNMLQTIQYFEYLVNHFYKSVITKLDSVHVLPGPLSVYRTAIVKKLGCFREAHKTEDMELAMRIQKAQYKIMQCNDAFVYTKTPYTIKSLYRQRHRWNYGTLRNLIDYRKMMFNKKYGDFGIFQLPMIMLSGLLGIIVLGLMSHALFKSIRPTFRLLQLYNYNIIELIRQSSINMIWLDVDLRALMTFVIVFGITLMIVWLSFKLYKQKYGLKTTLPFIFYLFFYYLFLAVVWLGVFKDYIIGTKVGWRK